jgi:hypothetical protein
MFRFTLLIVSTLIIQPVFAQDQMPGGNRNQVKCHVNFIEYFQIGCALHRPDGESAAYRSYYAKFFMNGKQASYKDIGRADNCDLLLANDGENVVTAKCRR